MPSLAVDKPFHTLKLETIRQLRNRRLLFIIGNKMGSYSAWDHWTLRRIRLFFFSSILHTKLALPSGQISYWEKVVVKVTNWLLTIKKNNS